MDTLNPENVISDSLDSSELVGKMWTIIFESYEEKRLLGGLSLGDTAHMGLTVYGTTWEPRLLFFFLSGPVNHHGLTIAISAFKSR